MESQKALVSGGAGVIGRELVRLLVAMNFDVLVIDRKPRPNEFPGNVDYHPLNISLYDEASINYTRNVLSDFSPHYFFHLAASFERLEESSAFYDVNFNDNTFLSSFLFKLMTKIPSVKKIVFASSYLAYDPECDNKFEEESVVNPRNLCGASKLYSESELKFISQKFGIESASSRIFRVYGKGSKDIIGRWIDRIKNDREIVIYNENNYFDYIYAGDVAWGLLKLAQPGITGIYNLGTGRPNRICDILEIIQKILGKKAIIKSNGNIDSLNECSYASMNKFHRNIGWVPKVRVEEGIQKILEIK